MKSRELFRAVKKGIEEIHVLFVVFSSINIKNAMLVVC